MGKNAGQVIDTTPRAGHSHILIRAIRVIRGQTLRNGKDNP